MKSHAETIVDLNVRCEGPDQFDRFDRAFRTTLTAPKSIAMKKEARQKKASAKRRAEKKTHG